jgi:sugar/nucleoside kinase (ribokinase family)
LISILCDILADVGFHIDEFPVVAGSLARSRELHITPGGASNVAIAASRLGLEVQALGEVGEDVIGDILIRRLNKERVNTDSIMQSSGAMTPLAGVIVDRSGEAAYIGYPGTLFIHKLTDEWREGIRRSQALFADGWADHDGVPTIVLEGFKVAHESEVPVFFDPGPGNPDFDRTWHREAARLSTVILATEEEARWLTGFEDMKKTGMELLDWGPELAVIKRGPGGCLLAKEDKIHLSPSFPVEILDNTGAGDALDASVIYGFLNQFNLEQLGALANAAGAAKLRKRGTGENMPTREEINDVLERFGQERIFGHGFSG